jgi:hypothetical protein
MSVTTGNDDKMQPPCKFCQNTPCLLEQGLYDSITEFEETLQDGNHDGTLTNKMIRFQLYRHATAWMHGFLGKSRRIEIPQCVRTEILDLAPESDGNYVGFRPATDSS